MRRFVAMVWVGLSIGCTGHIDTVACAPGAQSCTCGEAGACGNGLACVANICVPPDATPDTATSVDAWTGGDTRGDVVVDSATPSNDQSVDATNPVDVLAAEAGDPWLEGPVRGNGNVTGGYWWTYQDNIAVPTPAQQTAAGIGANDYPTTVSPVSSMTTPFIESDPTTHGLPAGPTAKAACIHTHIPEAPLNSALPAEWPYKDSSGDEASPMAGVGFSWNNKNRPFDLSAYIVNGVTGVVGLAFWAAASDTTHPFSVMFPDVHTDVGVIALGDMFSTSCTCTSTAGFCTPASSNTITGAVTVSTTTLKSCFAFWRYNFAPVDTNWHQYVVLFKDLAPGDESSAPPTPATFPWADDSVAFDTHNALKVQFDMWRPPSGSIPVESDFCVTNVDFVVTGDTTYTVTGVVR
jgi:hypothetical protein